VMIIPAFNSISSYARSAPEVVAHKNKKTKK
jgi:hypothetical protein